MRVSSVRARSLGLNHGRQHGAEVHRAKSVVARLSHELSGTSSAMNPRCCVPSSSARSRKLTACNSWECGQRGVFGQRLHIVLQGDRRRLGDRADDGQIGVDDDAPAVAARLVEHETIATGSEVVEQRYTHGGIGTWCGRSGRGPGGSEVSEDAVAAAAGPGRSSFSIGTMWWALSGPGARSVPANKPALTAPVAWTLPVDTDPTCRCQLPAAQPAHRARRRDVAVGPEVELRGYPACAAR